MKPRSEPGNCDFRAFFPYPRVFAELLANALARGGGPSQIFFGPKLPYVRQKMFFLDFLGANSLKAIIILVFFWP